MAVYGRSRGWSMQPLAAQAGGSSAAWRGNEPAGMTFMSSQDFTTMPSGGWNYFSGAATASDATAPKSPPDVYFVNVTADANSSGLAEKDISGTPFRTVYFCAWVKISSLWQGHITGSNKLGFFYIGGSNHVVWRAEGTGSNPLAVSTALQGIVSGGNDGGTAGHYDSNLSPSTVFRRGQWDLLEYLVTANTTGNADGTLDMYLNGVHCTNATGIEYVTNTSPTWETFQINTLWGGTGDTLAGGSVNQFSCDEIYLSGKN